LIVGQPGFLLGILKDPLDPVPLALQECQSANRRVRRCVAEGELGSAALAVRFTADDQVPAVGSLVSFTTEPNPLMKHFHLDGSLGALPCLSASPTLRWLLLGPLIGPNAACVRVLDRIHQVDPLIPMDVGHESQARVIERAQQTAVLSVERIHAHPLETNPKFQGMFHDVQC
jgi:hypothetical protein